MKSFACGDVVPGCAATFLGPDVDTILGLVATHAGHDHGLAEVPPELVTQVRENIHDAD